MKTAEIMHQVVLRLVLTEACPWWLVRRHQGCWDSGPRTVSHLSPEPIRPPGSLHGSNERLVSEKGKTNVVRG